MKQIIQSYKTGEMALEEVPRPQVTRGTVLVETAVSVISAGTEKMLVDLARKSLLGKARARPDLVRKVVATARREGLVNTLQKVRSKLDTPIPLGYSCAGIVRETGDETEGLHPGDPVACGGAGYANHAHWNVVPRNLCVKIPRPGNGRNGDPVSFEEAAFTTVGAIALQGVRQAALTLGESVAVIGLGLIGQLAVQLCKACGCRVLGADLDPAKIELALKLGADAAVTSGDLERTALAFTWGIGVDAVLVTASSRDSSCMQIAGEISRLKGRVVVVGQVGMEIPRDDYYRKELDVRLSLSYGPGRYDAQYEEGGHDYPLPYVRWTEQRNMQAFLELVAAGRVDVRPLVTHRFSFEESLQAYRMILGGTEPYLGVVLRYATLPEPRRIPVSAAREPQKESTLGIGVIGAGSFARGVLLPALKRHPRARFVGVATARGMNARAVAEQFGFAWCTENPGEILADDAVKALVVATRHNLHGPLVLDALRAGKHVFVEKPLCLNAEELAAIRKTWQDLSRDTPPVLMTGFNRRFSPLGERLRNALAGRSTPLVLSYRVNAGFVPRDSWVQDPVEGGGRILGEVCHFVDLLRFLVGAPVRTVQAACVHTDDVRHTGRDSVAVTLTYEDGSLGTVLYHALGSPDCPKERLEAAADGKVLVLDDYRNLEVYGGSRNVGGRGKQDKGFQREMEAFMGAVLDGGPPPIPVEEIFETTRVTFAIHEALNSGRTVSLEEGDEEGVPQGCPTLPADDS